MPFDATAYRPNEDREGNEHFEVTLRFKNAKDIELLMADIDLLLESLGEEGYVVRTSDDD